MKRDPIDTAAIERADRFDATIFLGTGQFRTETFGSLAAARAAAGAIAREVNNGRKVMIYAISAGRSVFVPDHYQPSTDEGANPMNTTLSTSEVAQLTAILTGGGFKRANTKEAAVKRFLTVAASTGIADAEALLAKSFDEARAALQPADAAGTGAEEPIILPFRSSPRHALMAKLKEETATFKAGAPEPEKAVKAEKARKPAGQRAAVLEAAQHGELPPVPDFSAPTHKPHRKRLEQVVALVEAGDIEGLKAFKINPVSSSPKAIDKYRNLAVIALEARGSGAAAPQN